MGFGEFGNNGSVHWRVKHTADESKDPPGFVQGLEPEVTPSEFTLQLRFKDAASANIAKAALEDAIIRAGSGEVRVTFGIPVLRRADPEENKPWEIQIAWSNDGRSM